MNSAFLERVQGFLNNRSVSHSVELRVKNGAVPSSSSSQCSIGVTSAAKLGANVAAPPLTFQLAAPPSSTIAAGSFSTVCAKAFPMENANPSINAMVALVIQSQSCESDGKSRNTVCGCKS